MSKQVITKIETIIVALVLISIIISSGTSTTRRPDEPVWGIGCGFEDCVEIF